MARVTRQGRKKILEYVNEEVGGLLLQEYERILRDDDQNQLVGEVGKFFDGETVQVGSRDEVLAFLEFGTEPHVITPSDAEALRFEVDNEVVYASRVEHPGTEPRFYLRGALQRTRAKLQRTR